MAGRILRDMHRTADYKGSKALKSCHTEFFTSILCGFPQYNAGRKCYFFFLLSLFRRFRSMRRTGFTSKTGQQQNPVFGDKEKRITLWNVSQ
jgi:hypothetical protein